MAKSGVQDLKAPAVAPWGQAPRARDAFLGYAAAGDGFNPQERAKLVSFLQYLRGVSFGERTLAAVGRGLRMDWASVYFCVGAGVAAGWVVRERVGRSIILSVSRQGVMAIPGLRPPMDNGRPLEDVPEELLQHVP